MFNTKEIAAIQKENADIRENLKELNAKVDSLSKQSFDKALFNHTQDMRKELYDYNLGHSIDYMVIREYLALIATYLDIDLEQSAKHLKPVATMIRPNSVQDIRDHVVGAMKTDAENMERIKKENVSPAQLKLQTNFSTEWRKHHFKPGVTVNIKYDGKDMNVFITQGKFGECAAYSQKTGNIIAAAHNIDELGGLIARKLAPKTKIYLAY